VAKGWADDVHVARIPVHIAEFYYSLPEFVPIQDCFLSFVNIMDRCSNLAGLGCSAGNSLNLSSCQASFPVVRVCTLPWLYFLYHFAIFVANFSHFHRYWFVKNVYIAQPLRHVQKHSRHHHDFGMTSHRPGFRQEMFVGSILTTVQYIPQLWLKCASHHKAMYGDRPWASLAYCLQHFVPLFKMPCVLLSLEGQP
jgi:hypothetical protein